MDPMPVGLFLRKIKIAVVVSAQNTHTYTHTHKDILKKAHYIFKKSKVVSCDHIISKWFIRKYKMLKQTIITLYLLLVHRETTYIILSNRDWIDLHYLKVIKQTNSGCYLRETVFWEKVMIFIFSNHSIGLPLLAFFTTSYSHNFYKQIKEAKFNVSNWTRSSALLKIEV